MHLSPTEHAAGDVARPRQARPGAAQPGGERAAPRRRHRHDPGPRASVDDGQRSADGMATPGLRGHGQPTRATGSRRRRVARIFTKFWRGGARRGGTGLGLFIVEGHRRGARRHDRGRAVDGRRRPVPIYPARRRAAVRLSGVGRPRRARTASDVRRPTPPTERQRASHPHVRPADKTYRPVQVTDLQPEQIDGRARRGPRRDRRRRRPRRARRGPHHSRRRPRRAARARPTRARRAAAAGPAPTPASGSTPPRRAVNEAYERRSAGSPRERDARVLVEEAVDVTLPDRPRPARRPPPAVARSSTASPTSSSPWATRSPRGPRPSTAGTTSTPSTPRRTTRPASCRTRCTWSRPSRRSCCAPRPARCRSARCSSATCRSTSSAPAASSAPTPSTRPTCPCSRQVEGLAIDEGLTMADLRGTLDAFAAGLFARRAAAGAAAHPAAAALLPLHRTERRGRSAVLRLRRRAGRSGLPHLLRRGLARVGRLRHGRPRRAHRMRCRPAALHRLRVRHGPGAHGDGAAQHPRHPRADRRRRPVRARLPSGPEPGRGQA